MSALHTAAWNDVPTLRGSHVTLEPLELTHVDDLRAAVRDGELWRAWYGNVPAPDAMDAYVQDALAMRDAGLALPWIVRDADGGVVGATRFYDLAERVPRLLIGYTWCAARVQRTGLNTEAKLLLLTHAFDIMECAAVGFKTSWFNQTSRAAISRLGAKQDGVMRADMRHRDGSIRDSVVFSIVAPEWPEVRANLQAKLGQARHD